jgi:hypothetical protein
MNNQKSYKIIVRSKKMRNIRGANPAEVAKKVALKLLVKNIYNMYFSIIEIKTNKIIHYQSNKKELVRPYHKNGKLVKYQFIVKKIGKQVGGTYQPNLEDENDPIYIFFPKERFNISSEDNIFFGRIIHIKDLSENNCLQIIFHTSDDSGNDYIELFKLNRCQFQGSANLETLIKYAKYLKNILKINLDKIFLEDASRIPDTNIKLWLLSILTTGESWYNRFGFTSYDHDSDIEHNRKIIQMTFNEFINLCISKVNSKNFSIDILKLVIKHYCGDINMSVQETFTIIKNKLKTNEIEKNDIIILNKIFEIIYLPSIINYNPFLYYTIPETNS